MAHQLSLAEKKQKSKDRRAEIAATLARAAEADLAKKREEEEDNRNRLHTKLPPKFLADSYCAC